MSWCVCIQRVTNLPDHVLTIKQPLFSKARPRLTRTGHAYMPQPYKLAQAEMRRQLLSQWKQGPLEGPIFLELLVQGEGRGDSDNIAGAFMDAAHGILWIDDRVTIIPELKITWKKAPKNESLWVIHITNLENQPGTME
jgi:Holliday junction resolvase RusA-like endonuclease